MRKDSRLIVFRIVAPVGLSVVLFFVAFFLLIIPFIKNNLVESRHETIVELTSVATGMIDYYYEKYTAGELTLETAKYLAKEELREVRYGKKNKDYFWIHDSKLLMVMHPYRSGLEGESLSNFVDPDGKRLFYEMNVMVESNGSGFVEYQWQWQDLSNLIVPKRSFVSAFEPWGWIIGTGLYLDDINAEIAGLTSKISLIFGVIFILIVGLSVYIVVRWRKDEMARLKAEQALRESERVLSALISNLPGMVYRGDCRNLDDFSFISDGCVELTGYQPAQLMAGTEVSYTQIVDSDDIKELKSVIGRALSLRESYQLTYRIKTKNKKMKWVWEQGSGVYDSDGGLICVEGFIADITQKVLAEDERKKLNVKLEEKNKELEEVIYIISHDFRSPLANVRGFSAELVNSIDKLRNICASQSNGLVDSEEYRFLAEEDIPESIHFIKSSVEKMDQLLTGLTQLSRTGMGAIHIKEIDVRELVAELVRSMEYVIKEKSITIEIGELPTCLGDSLLLSQVFLNLIDNAVKYLSPDRQGVIRVTGFSHGDKSVYMIEDNGIGIRENNLKNVFMIFKRLNPRDSQGQGLGLNIARKIVERLKGSIKVESVYGEGSRFILILPGRVE